MISDLDIYTGTLEYKDIIFTFVFNKRELYLLSSDNEEENVADWFRKYMMDGVYTIGDPVYIEQPYIIGSCSETNHKIVFFTAHSAIGRRNSTLVINIKAYVIMNFDRDYADQIGFMSPEIDCIYPARNAIEAFQYSNEGVFSVQTHDFSETTSKPSEFIFEKKTVKVYFGVSRMCSAKVGKPPLELHSIMFFEFEKTDDYSFLLGLYRIAKRFISYLVYRQNISFSSVQIASPYQNNRHENYADLFIVNDSLNENETNIELSILEEGRYIRQEYLSGAEGRLLEDIANKRIYMRHIPLSYEISRHINEASFVLITAAFEWTFDRAYPKGTEKREATIEAEKKALEAITELKNNASGKLREVYKYLLKHISDKSLKPKIVQAGRDYGEIIDVFGKTLFQINHKKLDYNEMGTRIAEQRNNFAHGNLDKKFIDTSLLDVIFMERIVYAMQLKEYGIEVKSIQKAINDLFRAHIAF